jgi:hypothetical protein
MTTTGRPRPTTPSARFFRPFLGAIAISITLFGLSCGSPAQARPPFAASLSPGMQCQAAIGAAERAGGLPFRLMAAIGHVESGRRDPDTGDWRPWPWTINAEGQGFFYDTKAQAIAAVKALQARGVRSIDVGCMQVNLMHHPDAFASLEAAFDPVTNARYAARFLNELYAQTRDWTRATAMYHSATPELGQDYTRKVMAVWPGGRNHSAGTMEATEVPTSPGGRVVVTMPVNRMQDISIRPIGAFGVAPGAAGRGLDAYRAAPIAIANPFRIGG